MVDTPDTFAAALARAAAAATAVVTPVVKKAATNVKNEARRNSTISSGKSAARAPKTITYDIATAPAIVGATIGYEARDQGLIGHILERGSDEYGSVHNPPHRDLGRALDREIPQFVAELGLAIGKLL